MMSELVAGSPEWLEARRRYVGASEVGLLFGLPSFGGRTIADLWHEKKYGVTSGSKDTPSTRLGRKLEATVIEAAEEALGKPIVDRQLSLARGCNISTLDGRVAGSLELVEAKTSGIIGPSKIDQWGEDMTDEIPESYLVQVQAQLLVTGAELAYLAALIGGRGFAMFRIEPACDLQTMIAERSSAFVESLSGDVPPPEVPQLDTLKRLRRQPDKIVDIPDDLRAMWEIEKAAASEADKRKEAAQRMILAALGNAEAGRVAGGTFTYYEQKRAAYSVDEATFRVLRFKKD